MVAYLGKSSRGRSSSVEDPLDYAYGPSYTGVSGGWPPRSLGPRIG